MPKLVGWMAEARVETRKWFTKNEFTVKMMTIFEDDPSPRDGEVVEAFWDAFMRDRNIPKREDPDTKAEQILIEVDVNGVPLGRLQP